MIVGVLAAGCGSTKSKEASPQSQASAATTAATTAKASGQDVVAGPTINADLTDDFQIKLDVSTVKAGSVTFKAKNTASTDPHELVVVRTDLDPKALPFNKAEGKIDEEGAGLETIGEVEEVEHGKDGSVTLDLKPGRYVLLCNIAETEPDGSLESHFDKGMYVPFTVTA
jgi:uncharacterized cupredoxin-like copper-binding protein